MNSDSQMNTDLMNSAKEIETAYQTNRSSTKNHHQQQKSALGCYGYWTQLTSIYTRERILLVVRHQQIQSITRYPLMLLPSSLTNQSFVQPKNVQICPHARPQQIPFHLLLYKNVEKCTKLFANVSYNTEKLASSALMNHEPKRSLENRG